MVIFLPYALLMLSITFMGIAPMAAAFGWWYYEVGYKKDAHQMARFCLGCIVLSMAAYFTGEWMLQVKL